MPAYQPTVCRQARRRRSLLLAWLLTGSVLDGASSTIAAAPDVPTRTPTQRIVLSSPAFKIPFHIAAGGQQPVEVQLLVASPQPGVAGGPAWRMLQSQPPGRGHFQLSGITDGQYDFATRTVDAAGNAEPAGPPVAELRVVVDTTKPVVRLEPQTDADGQVTVGLLVEDITSIQTVEAHYITDVTRHWYPTGPRIAGTDAAGSTAASPPSFRIQPRDQWRQLSVRVRVVDEAGNETLTTQMIDRPRIAAGPGRLASGQSHLPGSSFSTPWNPPPAAAVADPFAPPAAMTGFGQPAAHLRLPPPASADQISELPPPFGFDPPTSPASPMEPAAPPPALPPAPRTAAEAMRPLPPAAGAVAPVPADLPAVPPAFQGVEDLPPPPPAVATAKPAAPAVIPETSFKPADVAPPIATPQFYDDRVVIQPSDSNRFSLEYEVEAVGRQGLATVELYGTLDGGQSWRLWGEDPDRQSPFDIETAGEGDFGFRIVVVGAGGLASPRPQPGDAPDIAVRVDQTSPRVELLGAKFGVGDRVGSLVIDYRGDDANLRSRGMTLSFGPSADGPWTTIAAGLPAEGQHVWAADPNLPRLLHLRVDGVDEAGNTASDVTDEPIDTRGFAPRARIRGFRPLD